MAEITDLDMEFDPFEDDGAEMSIGNLSVENGTRGLLLHGDIEFGRDATSLSRIKSLIKVLRRQQTAMEAVTSPEGKTSETTIETVKNPFL